MGFLSQNADKAFKKASKRAYVPPWWKPASYLAGGLALALVIVFGVIGRDQDPTQYASAGELEGAEQVGTVRQEIVLEPSAGTDSATTSPGGQPQSPSPAPSGTGDAALPVASETPSPGGSAGAGELPTSLGGTIRVDPKARELAKKAGLALYTGKFAGVPIYDNLQPPAITRTWPRAAFVEVESADDLSGQGYIFQVVIDPDSAQGPEAPRKVQVIIIKNGSTWLFQPF